MSGIYEEEGQGFIKSKVVKFLMSYQSFSYSSRPCCARQHSQLSTLHTLQYASTGHLQSTIALKLQISFLFDSNTVIREWFCSRTLLYSSKCKVSLQRVVAGPESRQCSAGPRPVIGRSSAPPRAAIGWRRQLGRALGSRGAAAVSGGSQHLVSI